MGTIIVVFEYFEETKAHNISLDLIYQYIESKQNVI